MGAMVRGSPGSSNQNQPLGGNLCPTDRRGGGSKNCKGFASCIKTIVCIYGCRHRDTAAVSPPVTSLFAPSINTDRFDWH